MKSRVRDISRCSFALLFTCVTLYAIKWWKQWWVRCLKGLYREDITVLGQFCANVITQCLYSCIKWTFGVLIYQCGKFYQRGTLSIIFLGWFWGVFLVLWKLFLVSYWVVVWILFITVFSIIFITSLGDCTRPQHEEIPIFAGLASKFENVGPIFSSFNPCLSLPSVARDDKKQF